jgi:hypothetical protein
MKSYDTLIEAIQDLKNQGYTYDFNLMDKHIHCKDITTSFGPDDFQVKAVYRFEGMSNPSDNSILYAIETLTGVKGLLMDSYGVYSGEISEELLQKLNMNHISR